MPKLLIVTRHTPLPWEDGAGTYLHDLARFLARAGFRVEVLWLAPHEHLQWRKFWRLPATFDAAVRLLLPHTIRFGRSYVFVDMIWPLFKARALHRARQLLSAVGIRVPRRQLATVAQEPARRSWMSPPSLAELAVVERVVRKQRPDIVLANYAWMCPIFNLSALQSVRRACLAPDVAWSRAELAAAETGLDVPPEITRFAEAAWLQLADTIVAIAECDATELRIMAPTAEVLVAPKACEISATLSLVPDRAGQRLLFVGSGNSFNAEGLGWFLREVWPLLARMLPGTRLDVCGSIDQAMPQRPEGVNFHGNVPDLAPFYREAGVVIVPLLRASGLNIKLVDAAAAGRAIVATSITLAGAPFLRGAVHTADTAANFAAAIHLLLTDTVANRASVTLALAAVRTHLSPVVCYGSLGQRLRAAA